MRYIATFTLFMLLSFAFAQQKDVSYLSKSFSASAIKNLEVQTSGGSIRVEGSHALVVRKVKAVTLNLVQGLFIDTTSCIQDPETSSE